MHLNAKKLAFLGLLLSFDVILVILSGVFEFNTLFLLAAASFCVEIAIRECNLQLGFGFFLGSVLLSVILAPNKLYCLTYGAMALYIVIIEYAFVQLVKVKSNHSRIRLFWIIKYVVFNALYIPIIFLLPKLIYEGEINLGLRIVLLLGGQLVLYIYDRAYEYFQGSVWSKIRRYIKIL